MEILCLSPPDNLLPFSPIFVLYLSTNLSAISSTFAIFAAVKTSSVVAFGLPHLIFSKIVSSNNSTS